MCVYTYTYTCTCRCTCTYTYTHTYIYIHACIYIHICIHITPGVSVRSPCLPGRKGQCAAVRSFRDLPQILKNQCPRVFTNIKLLWRSLLRNTDRAHQTAPALAPPFQGGGGACRQCSSLHLPGRSHPARSVGDTHSSRVSAPPHTSRHTTGHMGPDEGPTQRAADCTAGSSALGGCSFLPLLPASLRHTCWQNEPPVPHRSARPFFSLSPSLAPQPPPDVGGSFRRDPRASRQTLLHARPQRRTPGSHLAVVPRPHTSRRGDIVHRLAKVEKERRLQLRRGLSPVARALSRPSCSPRRWPSFSVAARSDGRRRQGKDALQRVCRLVRHGSFANCHRFSDDFYSLLLVTTVTEVSPPFLGVPQIWRSRSGYKSIAVSFAITGSSFALACLPRRREQVRGIPSYRPAEYVVNLQRVAPLRPFGTSAAPPRRSLGAFDRFLRPNSPFFSGPPLIFSSPDSRTSFLATQN